MPALDFRPVVYLKSTCPHCLKLRIFLLESGLEDSFEQRIFVTDADSEEERAIRGELAPYFEKVTFPTVQLEPGAYLKDSDAIIAALIARHGIDRSALDVFETYADAVLPRYMEARKAAQAAAAG